jgi:hypothetical protein
VFMVTQWGPLDTNVELRYIPRYVCSSRSTGMFAVAEARAVQKPSVGSELGSIVGGL